jgi:hypothetical protein
VVMRADRDPRRSCHFSEVRFAADADEVVFSPSSLNVPIVGADPYLNEVLVKLVAVAALAGRRTKRFKV